MPKSQIKNAIVYNLDPFGSPSSPPESMLSFLRLLRQRYEQVLSHSSCAEGPRRQQYRKIAKTLAFTEAFLEKESLFEHHPDLPINIAVLGPTQSGKSSVINWLLDDNAAKVSPLAGFTVHPQGFSVGVEPSRFNALNDYYRNYQRSQQNDLNPEQLDCFTLDQTPIKSTTRALQGSILWDSPDFDSVEAEDYQDAVLRTAALADIIILGISKDKYADLSVWDLLALLEPLGQPTFIVLNKTDPEAATTLMESLHTKWRSCRQDAPPPIVALPYIGGPEGLLNCAQERNELLNWLAKFLGKRLRTQYKIHTKQVVNRHWISFIDPLIAEHRLQKQWLDRVEDAIHDSMERYQRDYLDHPNHYETFQRALAELLTLLELPGIGGALITARQVVTWPVRQFAKFGKSMTWNKDAHESGEVAVLHQLAEHALIRIGEGILLTPINDPIERIWWGDINGLLTRTKSNVIANFDHSAVQYQKGFQPEIDRTARGLYERLQQHPVVLNTLRATRVTTDAVALAMALHTGGIGVQDLVIAPAMLSVTSLLTESAIGRYMNRAQEQLKKKQKESVEQLFRNELFAPLICIPDLLDPATRLNVSPEMLAAAEALRS